MRAGFVALANSLFGWVAGIHADPVSPAREVVRNMYLEILERPPDSEGLNHYLTNGVSVAQIGDELLRSEEFRSKRIEEGLAVTQAAKWKHIMSAYPAQINDFVYLYGKLLGRDVDSDTMRTLQTTIEQSPDAPTVYDITNEIVHSQEFTESYAYWKTLGRPVDDVGKAHFATIGNGPAGQPWPLSIVQVVDELVTSDEFRSNAMNSVAVLELEHFSVSSVQARACVDVLKHFKVDMPSVTHLYVKMLGRYPDDGAKSYYQALVADETSDLSVLDLLKSLVESEEFLAQGPLVMKNTTALQCTGTLRTGKLKGQDCSKVYLQHEPQRAELCRNAPGCALTVEPVAPSGYLLKVKDVKVRDHYLQASSPITMIFTIGDHPSKDGDEATMVDRARIRSTINQHGGV